MQVFLIILGCGLFFSLGIVVGIVKAEEQCDKHEWEHLTTVTLYDDWIVSTVPSGYKEVYVCKKCKKKKIVKY